MINRRTFLLNSALAALGAAFGVKAVADVNTVPPDGHRPKCFPVQEFSNSIGYAYNPANDMVNYEVNRSPWEPRTDNASLWPAEHLRPPHPLYYSVVNSPTTIRRYFTPTGHCFSTILTNVSGSVEKAGEDSWPLSITEQACQSKARETRTYQWSIVSMKTYIRDTYNAWLLTGDWKKSL